MPGIEFLPERQEDGDSEERSAARFDSLRLSKRVLAAVAGLALLAVAAIVVGAGGGGASRHPAAAKVSVSPSPSPSPSPSASALSLPESVAFGPEAEDVLAVGNRIFALTPTLIGAAERDSGSVTVRPTPLGLSIQTGYGKLVPDLVHRIVWVVAIGGTAIGEYDTDHLDALADAVSPYPINGAVAMDEQLYFTTDHGLYSFGGGGKPRRVPGPAIRLGAVTADLPLHQILAADYHSPNRLHVLTSYGDVTALYLPFPRIESLGVADGKVWSTGEMAGSAAIYQLDPVTLSTKGPGSISPQLGSRDDIVASYGNRLLVRATPDGTSMFCMDATTGAFKQKWTVPAHGAVSLNQRGLLVTTSAGITEQNARDCLAGR
jgi:hypothetical protein